MWSAGARAAQHVLQFAFTAALARLLLPEDFGLVAMITVFTGFAAVLVDFGLAAALVQRPTLEERHRSAAFWMNLVAGLLLAGVLSALAPWLAVLYDEPRLRELAPVLSLNFVFSSTGLVQAALLQRAMNFRRLAGIQVVSTIVAGAVAVGAAVAGAGVWSLIVFTLASSLFASSALWLLSDWRPRLTAPGQAVRELWGFSGNLLGFSVINYWSRNADNLIVGKFAGPAALGIYSRAYYLMLMPLDQISQVVARVMFPALSRIQDDRPRVKRAYLRAVGIIGLLSFPLMAGLFAVAEPFVLTFYGGKWESVVPVLQILCVAGFLQPLGTTVGWIYLSQGRTDLQFRVGLFTNTLTVVSFAIGIHWGVHGVATAYAIRSYALMYVSFAIPGRLIDMRVSEVFRAARGALLAALVMAAVVWGVGAVLPSDWPAPVALVAQTALGFAVYGGLVRAFRLESYRELKAIFRERARREPAAATGGQ